MSRAAALVIFARVPDAASVKTRLRGCLADDERLALYVRVMTGAIERLRLTPVADVMIACAPEGCGEYFASTGLRVFEQEGADIGARMLNAVDHVLRLGYAKAVLAGTDIPALDASHAGDAIALLDHADVVFGPALDGGYYMIGMKAAHAGVFDGIRWSTPDTLSDSLRAAHALGLSVALTARLRDMDRPEDLTALRAEGLL